MLLKNITISIVCMYYVDDNISKGCKRRKVSDQTKLPGNSFYIMKSCYKTELFYMFSHVAIISTK